MARSGENSRLLYVTEGGRLMWLVNMLWVEGMLRNGAYRSRS